DAHGRDVAEEAEMTERIVRETLEQMLSPWFVLASEVRCRLGDQWLRIDYLATPKIDGFPYSRFGIETKRGDYYAGNFRNYTRGLKQAADYTHAEVDGERIGVVFLFPGPPEKSELDPRNDFYRGMIGGADRAFGQFRVGTIVIRQWRDGPELQFRMNGDRVW